MAYADIDKLSRKLRYIFGTYGVSGVIDEKVNKALKNSTADVVEVKHGEWIRPTMLADMMHNVPHCSICGEVPCDEGKYCPNCGAKMDGGKEE